MICEVPGLKSLASMLALVASFAAGAQSQEALQAPASSEATALAALNARWQPSFDAFSAADLARPPQAGGVLFVGSSSIRLWNDLEKQFDAPIIVKRGFGGSRMSDCTKYLARLVLPYKPRMVIVYAGDNDLAEGRTPQEVLRSFTAFVDGVHKALPDARIAFLSIKPSPRRVLLLPRVRETNKLIAAYSATAPYLDYIDVYSKMLGEDGQPRAELFRDDSLHLNEAGYSLWQQVIAAYLH